MDNKLPPIYFNIRVVMSKALSRYLTGSPFFGPENFVVCVWCDIKKTLSISMNVSKFLCEIIPPPTKLENNEMPPSWDMRKSLYCHAV